MMILCKGAQDDIEVRTQHLYFLDILKKKNKFIILLFVPY